jgi:hypothetical protein
MLAWLVYWWVPVVGIKWDSQQQQWIQHGRDVVPEYVLTVGAQIWLLTLIASVIAGAVWLLT